MKPIPQKYRKQANEHFFYQQCCLCDTNMVEYHHPLYYSKNKQQIAEIFVPACKDCHDNKKNKLKFEWIAINMYYDYLCSEYIKGNWNQRKSFLNQLYGEYNKKGLDLWN